MSNIECFAVTTMQSEPEASTNNKESHDVVSELITLMDLQSLESTLGDSSDTRNITDDEFESYDETGIRPSARRQTNSGPEKGK